jgi:hypothetical protein
MSLRIDEIFQSDTTSQEIYAVKEAAIHVLARYQKQMSTGTNHILNAASELLQFPA